MTLHCFSTLLPFQMFSFHWISNDCVHLIVLIGMQFYFILFMLLLITVTNWQLMSSVSNREAEVCSTLSGIRSSEALIHSLALNCCVTIGKSLYLSGFILPGDNYGAKGNSDCCLYQTMLKHRILFTIFTNISTFFHLVPGEHGIVKQDGICHNPRLWYLSLRCKGEYLMRFTLHSLLFYCTALCSSLPLFLLYSLSARKM